MKRGVCESFCVVFRAAYFFLAACCLWHAAQCIFQSSHGLSDADPALDYADIVAGLRGRHIGYVATDAIDLDPTDRKRVKGGAVCYRMLDNRA